MPEAVSRTKPRVLIAVDLYPDGGGIAAIVENLIVELAADYEVELAIVDRRATPNDQLRLPASHVHSLGSRTLIKPYLMPTSLVYPLYAGRFLRSLVKQLNPEVLIVQDGLFLPLPGSVATHGTGTKLAVMDHGTLTNSLDPAWSQMFVNQLEFPKSLVYRVGFTLDMPWRSLRWRLGLRRADAVWYVGEELKPWLAKAGVKGERYAQLVPRDFAPPTSEMRAAARDALRIPTDATVVNMVTRIAGEKGLPLVAEALRSLRSDFPSLRVLVVGSGPLETWLCEEIDRNELPITLLGSMGRQDIAKVHHASDFHLYAGTIGCGMSVALLEAMAAGVIPIVSDIPKEQRILVGDAGWVFAAGDQRALDEALAAALSSSAETRESLRARVAEQLVAYQTPRLTDRLADLLVATPT